MTRAEAVRHAQHWIDAWNARDLDRILSCYAGDVVFEAETVRKRWQKDDGMLHGTEELRKHFALGLTLAPDETQFGGGVPAASSDAPSPPLFTAVEEQLGLKLVATKGPVEAMVVDEAEAPSAN